MIKILISVYIAIVLLIAGFAEASTLESATLSFDRVQHSKKVWLNIDDTQFDSKKEVLIVSGQTSSECMNSLAAELQFNERTNNILVSVTATGERCLADNISNYEIVIDLKAFFTETAINTDRIVHFQIDNYTGSETSAFNYLARKQVQYSFNTISNGQIEFDLRTQKFYLTNASSKIEIHSRFSLENYVNKFVQVTGLIPENITIGDDVSSVAPQLFISNLISVE